MYTTALLGVGPPLYAMHPAFKLKRAIDIVADHFHLNFFITSNRTLAFTEDSRFPAAFFTIFDGQPEQIAGKKPGFVAPGAGPYFQDSILLILRVFGYQQLPDMRFQPVFTF